MALDIQVIRDSFENVKPIAGEAATYFYKTLFEDYPEVKSLFNEDRHEAQKAALIASLVFVVEHLDQPEKLTENLRSMGGRHVAYGVDEAHYPAVGKTLIKTLSHFFKDAWTPELEEQWGLAFDFIAKTMIEGMNEKRAAAPLANDAEVIDINSGKFVEPSAPPASETAQTATHQGGGELPESVVDQIVEVMNELNPQFPAELEEKVRAQVRGFLSDMYSNEVRRVVEEEVSQAGSGDASVVENLVKKAA